MTRENAGREQDSGLKQVREEGHIQFSTGEGVEEDQGSDRGGAGSARARDRVVLDSALQQLRGVIGRYPEAGQEYVFEFDSVGKRCVHMLAVTQPLQVEFYVDGDLVREELLSPWTGFACARCDQVVERRPS